MMTYVVDEQNMAQLLGMVVQLCEKSTPPPLQKTAIFGPSKWTSFEFDGNFPIKT